ncbi:MAG TPA: hypothetical protein VF062_07420 [Candidatus Limnocylindrales bacterium]
MTISLVRYAVHGLDERVSVTHPWASELDGAGLLLPLACPCPGWPSTGRRRGGHVGLPLARRESGIRAIVEALPAETVAAGGLEAVLWVIWQ